MKFLQRGGLLALALMAVSGVANAQDLFIGDFGGNALMRFNGVTGAGPSGSAVVNNVEHIQTTASTVYANSFFDGKIKRFDRATLAALPDFATLPGGLGLQTSADSSKLFTTNSRLNLILDASVRRYDITSGLVEAEVNLSTFFGDNQVNPWSIRLDSTGNNLLFSMGFSGDNTFTPNAARGIYSLPTNFTNASTPVTLVSAANLGGINRPAGVAVLPSGDFFVVGSQFDGGPITINRYAAGGGAPIATVVDGVGGAIFNTLSGYDIAIGFDGNLYATANPSSGNACVLKINVATNTLDSTFVSASGGVHLAKTLHFDQFSAAAAAPEPGTLVLGALGLMGLVVARRRKH